MASIVKRKKKYSVVYTYTDENGNKRQKWETFETNDRSKRKGSCRLNMSRSPEPLFPLLTKTVNDLWMSICQSMV